MRTVLYQAAVAETIIETGGATTEHVNLFPTLAGVIASSIWRVLAAGHRAGRSRWRARRSAERSVGHFALRPVSLRRDPCQGAAPALRCGRCILTRLAAPGDGLRAKRPTDRGWPPGQGLCWEQHQGGKRVLAPSLPRMAGGAQSKGPPERIGVHRVQFGLPLGRLTGVVLRGSGGSVAPISPRAVRPSCGLIAMTAGGRLALGGPLG